MITTKTVTTYQCDRCGETAVDMPHERRIEWGTVQMFVGGNDHHLSPDMEIFFGDETPTLKGRTICPRCVASFLGWFGENYARTES